MIAISENDWLLQSVVNEINGTDKEIRIAVIVEGMMVSGNLVSSHKYYDEIYNMFNVLPEGQERVDISTHIMLRRIESASSNIIQSKDELESPTFFHLQNAKFGQNPDKTPGVLWRGTIEKVSGFSFN